MIYGVPSLHRRLLCRRGFGTEQDLKTFKGRPKTKSGMIDVSLRQSTQTATNLNDFLYYFRQPLNPSDIYSATYTLCHLKNRIKTSAAIGGAFSVAVD